MYKILVLLLAVCCVAACGSDDSGKSGVNAAPDDFEVANATYSGIYDEPVKLTNGRWEGRPFADGGSSRPTVELVRDFLLTGDVTGDGNEEAVVLLAESSGGSGTFQYLAVVGRSGTEASNLGTAAVGDRVQTIDCKIENGSIVMDVVQAGPGDAMCCPTQVAHKRWRMESGSLREVQAEVTGKLSVEVLEGREWVLDSFSRQQRAPKEPEVTLTFEDGRAAGVGGCNRYFATVEESSPGEISFGQIGATMMSCPEDAMAVEQRYHRALEGVTGYSFVAGRLALSYYDDGSMRSMMFHRRNQRSNSRTR